MSRIIRILSMVAVMAMTIAVNAFPGEDRIVVLDCSSSVGEGARSPYEINVNMVRSTILSTPKDSNLYVFAFAKGPTVPLLTASTPNIAGPRGKNLKATLEAGVRKFEQNLSGRRKELDKSGTDIKGALFRAARLFSEGKADTRTLYVMSDMQHEVGGEKLTLKNILKGSVSTNGRSEAHPDLKGVKVHIYSAFNDMKGMNTSSTEQAIIKLKAYWTEYLTMSGAVIVEYRTNY